MISFSQAGARVLGATIVLVATAALMCASHAQGQAPTQPAVPAPTAAPSPSAAPPGDVVLSDERTSTTWTTAVAVAPARSAPSPHSRVVGRLRYLTSDGFLQSYIALRQRRTASGTWVEVRLPMRPNGRTGWVPRGTLDTYQRVDTEIVLNRARRQLQFFRGGNLVLTAPIGIGKPSTPTPPGHFWITEKFPVHGSPVYGPYAFGTSDYSVLTDWPGGGVIGLHGTDQPQLVPGTPSHGCVRLHNSDVLRLSRLVPVGTPLLIQ